MNSGRFNWPESSLSYLWKILMFLVPRHTLWCRELNPTESPDPQHVNTRLVVQQHNYASTVNKMWFVVCILYRSAVACHVISCLHIIYKQYVSIGIKRGREETSCHGRCRAPGCFVVLFLRVSLADGVGWGGVGWDVNVHVTLMMLRWSWGGVGC